MTNPTFSIIIPTRGSGDLLQTIHSIRTQRLIDGDEIIVVGDGPQPEVAEIVRAVGSPFRYIFTDKPTADWGHSQQNFGLLFAKGTHVLTQGDDDIFLPRSFEIIRSVARDAPSVPLMFRFWTNDRLLVWSEADNHQLKETMVGDHNLIAPNVPGKLGAWAPNYRGDLPFVVDTLKHYNDSDVIWRKEIITFQRPKSLLRGWPVEGDPELERTWDDLIGEPPVGGVTVGRWLFSLVGVKVQDKDVFACGGHLILAPDNKMWGFVAGPPVEGYFVDALSFLYDAAHGDMWTSIRREDQGRIFAAEHLDFIHKDEKDGRIVLWKMATP